MHLRIIPAALLLTALLCACAAAPDEGQRTLDLRAAFLAAPGCSGQMDLVADYGERVYEYSAAFETDGEGTLSIALTAPEEVAGITATVAQGQTALHFDGLRLETGPLDPTGLSPLDALPALMEAMRSGYIAETGLEGDGESALLRICCRTPDQAPGTGRETVLWFDAGDALVSAELRQDGRTVVRCTFTGFALAPSAQDVR